MNGPRKDAVEVAVAARAELGEGPVWDVASQTLFWVDILVGHVHRFWPDKGVDVAVEVGSSVSAVGVRESGGLILALQDAVALVEAADTNRALSCPDGLAAYDRCTATGRLDARRLPGPKIEARQVRFNDATVDPEGRFLAGTMDWHEEAALGSLYQVGGDGTVTELVDGVTVSNGIDISDDGRRLYYVDSGLGAVLSYKRDPETGAIRDPQRVVEVSTSDGTPDGLTLDAEGCLWVAIWGAGEVRRYRPDGGLISVVEVPASQVTSVSFGGRDLQELFITTARIGLDQVLLAESPRTGDVFWLHTSTAGRAAPRYVG